MEIASSISQRGRGKLAELAGWLLETLQKPTRWDHPTVPPNAQPAAVATGRSEGDVVVVGVGKDSVESEG